jgi:hypothetical protein
MDKETLIQALIMADNLHLITQVRFELLANKVENNTALSISDIKETKALIDKLIPLWDGAEEKMTAQRNALTNLKSSL